MAIPRVVLGVLGTVAALTTTAILVIHIILAYSLADLVSPVRITAIIAAALEGLVLIAIVSFSFSYIGSQSRISRLRGFNGVWFGAGLILCTVSAAVSVASLICLNNATVNQAVRILGSSATGFLIGSSVALGLSFAAQLIFLVCHFIVSRMRNHTSGESVHTDEDTSQSAHRQRIKSIAYHHTSSETSKVRASGSMDSRSPPGSSGGRSATETMSSIRSSIYSVIHPVSSKTRLLSGSQRSYRRPGSLDSTTFRESRPVSTEDGFDSWDTSSVDPQNRQAVLGASSTPGRFLETIPASPTTSRSPSPGTPLDLEPPQTRRRSRSYSPGPADSAQRAAFTQQSNQSEAHIHPLFRSDSPTPPPIATPGTVVTAAPGAGQVITHKQSIRSLARMRSGSLPTVPSPLSRQGSFDSLRRRADSNSPELREEDEFEMAAPSAERKMTPPIPDWILSAGSRTSLSGYQSRKTRSSDEEEAPGQL
ncbi:hypothetical protein B0T17DRAFT_494994 [Bombardia bombarda]|uniref:Uncharacterized protein n=1 Tax=Bombardia bombarda TaxID=252184 RepID=A0AA39WTY4_9PEZI|nr:hypothetical protein B0T17DRAFT_494994 [Bombardia bombarda]